MLKISAMDFLQFILIDSPVFTWVILPFLIFCSRIIDQSIGTLRLILVSKGKKLIVPILAFIESMIWLLAIGQIMQHLDNFLCYVAYAGGFAMGNYVGIVLDEKLSIGNVIVRVIVPQNTPGMIEYLKSQNFGLTLMDAEGSKGPVKIIFSIIKRRDLKNFIQILNEYNPHAFYTIEEVKSVNEGVFRSRTHKSFLAFGMGMKKSK